MNDFTKEELAKLKLAIMILYENDELLETKKIAYRLQSMIDNYDDKHQFVAKIPDCITSEMIEGFFDAKVVQILPGAGEGCCYEINQDGIVIKKKVSDE